MYTAGIATYSWPSTTLGISLM